MGPPWTPLENVGLPTITYTKGSGDDLFAESFGLRKLQEIEPVAASNDKFTGATLQ